MKLAYFTLLFNIIFFSIPDEGFSKYQVWYSMKGPMSGYAKGNGYYWHKNEFDVIPKKGNLWMYINDNGDECFEVKITESAGTKAKVSKLKAPLPERKGILRLNSQPS